MEVEKLKKIVYDFTLYLMEMIQEAERPRIVNNTKFAEFISYISRISYFEWTYEPEGTDSEAWDEACCDIINHTSRVWVAGDTRFKSEIDAMRQGVFVDFLRSLVDLRKGIDTKYPGYVWNEDSLGFYLTPDLDGICFLGERNSTTGKNYDEEICERFVYEFVNSAMMHCVDESEYMSLMARTALDKYYGAIPEWLRESHNNLLEIIRAPKDKEIYVDF